ncbi:MAG: hypothetical protein ACPGSW_00445 [Phaeobacter italicus]
MTDFNAQLVIRADGTAVVDMARKSVASLDDVMSAAVKTAGGFKQLKTHSNGIKTGFQQAVAALSASDTAMERVQTSTTGLSNALKAQAAELVETQRETAAWNDQLRQLRARFDPMFAATERYEQELHEIAEAERLGAISAMTAMAARDRAAAGLNTLSGAQNKVVKSSGAMQAGVQNASYQIADAAVQLQMGTAATVVFAQQMPQLLGGMGIMGAVMGAVVAVGSPLVSMLLASGDATGTLDERMGKLDGSLQSVSDRLKILRDQDLSLTFGSMAGDVRSLTATLLDLDRAAELKNLRNTLDGLLQENVEPSWWQTLSQSISLGAAPMPGLTTEDYISGTTLKRENYAKLTGGRGPSFDEFQTRSQSITDLAKAGDVEQVTSGIKSLISDLAGGGPITDMNDELVKVLLALGDVAQKTAEIEALFNGSAMAARMDAEAQSMVVTYTQQADLAQAIADAGEDSAAVAAVRNAQAKEAVVLRLRELGIEQDSTHEREVLAALERSQAAEAKVRAAERQRSVTATLSDMSSEAAMAQAIARHGEGSLEVERLRADQAKQALQIRLGELGATKEQIEQAKKLLDEQRKATQEARAQKAEIDASQTLADLSAQANLNAAILRYGQDSLEVKRLQISAARDAFAQSLADLEISKATRDLLLVQWDIAKGFDGIDPFGTLASAQAILQAQTKSVAKLELEQRLLGQNARTKRRTLALYEAELAIRQKNIDAAGDLAQKIRDGALAQSDLAADLKRQADAWGDVQAAAEDAIDGIVDHLMDGNLSGALDSVKDEITSVLTDLAIKNPLKNAVLGTDLTTLGDAGGLMGIWDRLTGKAPAVDPAAAAAQAAAQSVATMQVTAARVSISTMSALGGMGLPANMDGRPAGSALKLSEKDIIDLKKTVATEWVQSAGEDQARGIIDTILNRQASGRWGSTVANVVDARKQFSDINGPVAWAKGRDSVDDLPTSIIDDRVNAVVDAWLSRRANGAASIIGDNLNYANPHYSDASNLGWISKLHGPRLGRGQSVHNHGTTAQLDAYRPDPFGLVLPDRQSAKLPGFIAETGRALELFGITTDQAKDTLGDLGSGFDLFAEALAQMGSGGGGSGGGGLFSAILGSVFDSMGLPGFRAGGDTGGSDPQRVAGLVHEREYVFDAAATARIGVANLEAIRRGTLPGYARGGYVGNARAYPFLVASAQGQQAPVDARPVINIIDQTPGPTQTETEEATDARGQRQYNIVISEVVATGMTGKPAKRQMQSTYGLRQRGTSRL